MAGYRIFPVSLIHKWETGQRVEFDGSRNGHFTESLGPGAQDFAGRFAYECPARQSAVADVFRAGRSASARPRAVRRL